MTRCLITGCDGFLGSHLAELLLSKGQEVYGTVYEDVGNLDHLKDRISLRNCDIEKRDQVDAVIKEIKPDVVYHAAAQSFVIVSWENPEKTLNTNVIGTFYLLEAMKEYVPRSTVVIVSTSAVYGPREEWELPLKEETDCKPTSMYAVSKIGEENLGYFYYAAFGMNVLRVRPFNMTGPRKTLDAPSDFARGIAEVEKGINTELGVGDIEKVRDYTDGRDAARALWVVAEMGKAPDIYNICSGKRITIRNILDTLLSNANVSVKYRCVPERIRKVDDQIYVGNNSKLTSLGWEPTISMETSLRDLLDWWREKL